MTFSVPTNLLDEEDEDDSTPPARTEAESTVSYQLEVEATPIYECDSSKCGHTLTGAGWPIFECGSCDNTFLVNPADIARAERKRMRERKLEAEPMECDHCSSKSTKMIGKESCLACCISTVTKYDAIKCPCSNCDPDEPAWVNVELF
jgi:hypothetical protein